MKKGFQPILDYVEGRMSITEFQFLFETDKSLQRTLKLPMDKKYTCYKRYNYNLFDLFKNYYDYKGKSWNIFANRSSIQGELVRLLEDYNISYHIYSKYKEEYRSKTKRIAMGKEKVKALFKYDKTYPRWVQGVEWPIVNGKPLVFSHQKKAKGGDIRTYYYFYDPDTKEQTVVEQFD